MSRLNQILAGILILQVGLIAYVFWPRSSAATGGDRLFADLASEHVSRLRIDDDQGSSIEFEKSQGGWVLAGTDGYPANGQQITETVESLISITRNRLVTQTPASHRRLSVAEDDFARRIILGTKDDEYTIYLGSSAGAGATHVRVADEDATYLTGEISAWQLETRPSSWIDTQYLSVSPAEITNLVLQNENGQFAFTRDADGAWQMEDLDASEFLNESAVETLVNRISSLRLEEPLGQSESPEYGLARPNASISFTTRNDLGSETAYSLLIGNQLVDEQGYYVKASNSPYYGTITTFVGDSFADQQRDDFVTDTPPEPDAGAQSSLDVSAPIPSASPLLSATLVSTVTTEAATTTLQPVAPGNQGDGQADPNATESDNESGE